MLSGNSALRSSINDVTQFSIIFTPSPTDCPAYRLSRLLELRPDVTKLIPLPPLGRDVIYGRPL